MGPVGRHGVLRSHGTQSHGMLVGALIAHHAHRADGGEQHSAGLPDMVVEAAAVGHGVMVHVLDIDVVCILQNAHFLTGDVAKDAHGKAGTGERMPLDESFRARSPHGALRL